MQVNYTLYVCRQTGTVNSVANCIANVDSNISMLALSLSPAPSSFGHGHFCGAIINNFGLLLIIVDSAWSFPAIVGSTWSCPVVVDSNCPLRTGWCLNLLTWPTLKNFVPIRSIWRKQTTHTWAVVFDHSGRRCDTPGSSSKPPSSSELLLLGAPAL